MRRGSPLAVLAIVMALWVGGRALTWENPFAPGTLDLSGADLLLAQNDVDHSRKAGAPLWQDKVDPFPQISAVAANPALAMTKALLAHVSKAESILDRQSGIRPVVQYGHHVLWMRAIGSRHSPMAAAAGGLPANRTQQKLAGITPLAPPFEGHQTRDRWSLDIWAFWREGSSAVSISQGRVPIYGASQVGAIAQFRAAPASPRDPRLFVRAYRAMVANGETELTAGASARLSTAIPVRVAAELRVSDTRFGTELRPAAMVVTELPAQQLPAGFRLEAYGGAGYVGGKAASAFADGQATITRELASFDGPTNIPAKLSFGTGAWGGAQKGASRVDVGPTMRLDLTLGELPARLSLNWRERVSGDASPGSGVAATLSTRF